MDAIWNPNIFGFGPSSYSIAIHLFVRLLGAIYVIAYIPFLFDVRGLFGKNGIRPMGDYLNIMHLRLGKRRFYYIPSLFWLNSSDASLFALVWSGFFLGILLMFGVWPTLLLLLLYLIHLSLTSAGQEFLSFGWETFLMELTVAALLITVAVPLNVFAWLGLNVLIMRFHVQAGASKLLSKDPNWRNLTAISYHYLTQPLPNTIAWYFHKLPMWFHKLSVLIMFYAELIVPFFLFYTPEVRLFVFTQLVGLQFFIWFTGNLSYLNHMTIVSSIVLLHNRFLEPYFGPPPILEESSIPWQIIISIFGIAFLLLQVVNIVQTFFPRHIFHRILDFVRPFHVSYPHGIFAIMTTKRYEIVVEGSHDGQVWKEYLFYYKPGDVSWRPRRVSPYQPRLDWQAWFLPFGYFRHQAWFHEFLVKLLQGSPPVTKLLKYNPFAEKPPTYVRALVYDYEFTTREEKEKTGNWWKRKLLGEYAPAIKLITKEEQ